MSFRNTDVRRLGQILIDNGLITEDHLDDALVLQKESGKKIGRVLIEQGNINPDQLVSCLAEQINISRAPIGFWDLSPDSSISVDVAKRNHVFPRQVIGNKIYLVMSDPFDVHATDDVYHSTGLSVVPEIATDEDLNRAMYKWYGERGAVEALEEDPEDDAEGPAARTVQEMIERALMDNVSDIHVEPHKTNCVIRYRVDGFLLDVTNLSMNMYLQVVNRLKVMAKVDISEKRLPQDGQIRITTPREVDLRFSSLPTMYGEKIVLRILDKTRVVPCLDTIGYQDDTLQLFKDTLKKTANGMILFCGPTGSGKTTSLYSVINELNTREVNIITVVDPPEYEIEGICQVPVSRKAGLTFAKALRSILRQDPNIIMIGEIRDEETASISVNGSTTGHLVLSSLHANDSASAAMRLIDMKVEPYLLASTLRCVVSQRLVRVICSECREEYTLTKDSPYWEMFGGITLARGKGCPKCNKTGYRGRIAIAEVLVVTPEVRSVIASNGSVDELRKAAGVKPLFEDLKQKVIDGITTPEEMMRIAVSSD